MKSPLNVVKERFGDKEKLVAAVQALATTDLWLDRVSENKGLANVSNAKLLRLHDVLSRTKQEFGSRTKLIAAILTATRRAKDVGYKERLERYPLPRLLDAHRAAVRRSRTSDKRAEATPPEKRRAPRSKKAKAKAQAKPSK